MMLDLKSLVSRGVFEEKKISLIALMINLVLLTFIVLPIFAILVKAFITAKGISLENFIIFWSNSYYREAFYATFMAAIFTVITTSLIGIPLAYILVRYDFPGKNFFSILVLVPLIMPPFVGALGLYKILGLSGVVNILLVNMFHILDRPINFLYGDMLLIALSDYDKIYLPYGIVLINTLHLYPLIYLNCAASLSNIDPSLEEQAENLGSRGFHLFRTITFPLMRPGWMAGAVLVFIWTFSDLGTPLIVHYFKMLSVIVFFKLYEITAGNPSPVSYVIGFIMVILSFITLFISRKYISLRRYVMLFAGGRHARRLHKPSDIKLIIVYLFLITLSLSALSPHIGLTLVAFSERWVLTLVPEKFTLNNFIYVAPLAAPFIFRSFIYSLIAAAVDIVLGAFIAYIVSRKLMVGGDLLDLIATLPLAVPGIIFGLGYWALFYKVPLLDPLSYTLIILTISYSMRRLPYTVRAAYAGLLQIDEALEEASINLGATRLKTFRRITLPLLVMNLFAGGILSFINALIEVSTTFLLVVTDRYAPTTWFLYFRALADPRRGLAMASAVGFLFVVIIALALFITNKILGSRMGSVFRL